jgi:hypothetical protein
MDYPRILGEVLEKYFEDVSERMRAKEVLRGACCPRGWEARVGIAALKISGNDLQKLSELIAQRNDYRDLVALAEYPQSGRGWRLRRSDPSRYQQLADADRIAYLEWLHRLGIDID